MRLAIYFLFISVLSILLSLSALFHTKEPHSNEEHYVKVNNFETQKRKANSSNVKIVAFTDHSFAPVGQWWYQRLTNLTYTTHTLVLFESRAVAHFEKLKAKGEYYRTEVKLIDIDNKLKRRFKIHRLWYIRILYCLEQLKAGTSLILTDSDNIFHRYVDLSLFEDSGYDAIFSFEQRYPTDIFKKQGFVVCGGMTFLKATNATVQIIEKLLQRCYESQGREGKNSKSCDDQTVWNELLFQDMEWNRKTEDLQAGQDLLQFGFDGISKSVPSFRANLWDRQFSLRIPFETCPSEKTWVSMPAPFDHRKELEKKVKGQHGGFLQEFGLFELAKVLIWEKYCSLESSLDSSQRLEQAVSYYVSNSQNLIRPYANFTQYNGIFRNELKQLPAGR